MRQNDQDTLYEAVIFSKQATDDERWEMDHREASRIGMLKSLIRYVTIKFLLINTKVFVIFSK